MLQTDRFVFVDEQSQYWQDIYLRAQNDKSHELWKNYQKINLSEYEHMIVHLRNEKPISFHGIYNNGRWPTNVSRAVTRLYTVPEHRDILCTTMGDSMKFDADNFNLWGKTAIFVSKNVQYNNSEISYKKFSQGVRLAKKYTGHDWVHNDRLYQCCNNPTKDCYQFLMWFDPNNRRHTIDIPSLSIGEWKQLKS